MPSDLQENQAHRWCMHIHSSKILVHINHFNVPYQQMSTAQQKIIIWRPDSYGVQTDRTISLPWPLVTTITISASMTLAILEFTNKSDCKRPYPKHKTKQSTIPSPGLSVNARLLIPKLALPMAESFLYPSHQDGAAVCLGYLIFNSLGGGLDGLLGGHFLLEGILLSV